MATISFKVGSIYCYDCVKALKSFIGKMKGVQSINMMDKENIVIEYDPSNLEFNEEKFRDIVINSINKLGFKVIEE